MGKLLDDAKASSEIKRINERLKDLARNFGTDSKIYQQLQNTILNATAVENRQARAYGKIARQVYGSVAERKQSELLGITDKRSFEFRSKMDQAMKEIGSLLHDGDETKAKEKITEIKEVIDSAKEKIR